MNIKTSRYKQKEISRVEYDLLEVKDPETFYFVRDKPTNGDKLRSMTDVELAEFLMTDWFTNGVCKNCEGEYDRCGDLKFCEFKILEWLKKESI